MFFLVSSKIPGDFARSTFINRDEMMRDPATAPLSFRVRGDLADEVVSEAAESSRTDFARYLRLRYDIVHPTTAS